MSESQVLYAVSARVALITLNRPAAMNALAGTMREDILAGLERAAADPEVGVVVITGAGDAFCAGGDIANMLELQARDDARPVVARTAVASDLIQFLRAMDKPVIAAINGAAAGGGANLALACDIRYGSTRTRFAESFVKIGLVPDWGGHYLLTRLVGTSRAMELMMHGDRIDADEAYRLGIINRIFPAESFMQDVLTRAEQLAQGPAAALAAIKHGVYLGAEQSLATVLAYEQRTQEQLFLGEDAREGMRAFMEKRSPRFQS
ncbi:MAG: enoyl-CoA hydratase/isomerase family protein [Gammaproteobacteria bacterium]|nr:enoyl-CoA hydratase/isomerase family protein [Gammaproteobacteria bacterium]